MSPPPEVAEAVAAAAAPLRIAAPTLNWVEAADLHLTVVFLGMLEEQVADAAAARLAGVAAGTAPLELRLSGAAGTFGSRVLWAGVEACPPLEVLAGQAAEAAAAAGVPVEERPFRPHLTLARAGRRERLPHGLASVYDGPRTAWRVDRLRLWGPAARGRGVRYAERAAWPLTGPH